MLLFTMHDVTANQGPLHRTEKSSDILSVATGAPALQALNTGIYIYNICFRIQSLTVYIFAINVISSSLIAR